MLAAAQLAVYLDMWLRPPQPPLIFCWRWVFKISLSGSILLLRPAPTQQNTLTCILHELGPSKRLVCLHYFNKVTG